jgi:hypothetical protein
MATATPSVPIAKYGPRSPNTHSPTRTDTIEATIPARPRPSASPVKYWASVKSTLIAPNAAVYSPTS